MAHQGGAGAVMNMVMDGLNPRSRSTDPVTSLEAGRLVEESASTVKERVYRVFEIFGSLTDEQLTEHYFLYWKDTKLHIDSPRKRRSELCEAGVLEAVWGVTRRSSQGVQQQVYRITPMSDDPFLW